MDKAIILCGLLLLGWLLPVGHPSVEKNPTPRGSWVPDHLSLEVDSPEELDALLEPERQLASNRVLCVYHRWRPGYRVNLGNGRYAWVQGQWLNVKRSCSHTTPLKHKPLIAEQGGLAPAATPGA